MTHENGVTRSGPLWEAVVDGQAAASDFHYNIIGIDPDFPADNGFVPRVGYVRPSVSNRYHAGTESRAHSSSDSTCFGTTSSAVALQRLLFGARACSRITRR